jgi:hypothetical protein
MKLLLGTLILGLTATAFGQDATAPTPAVRAIMPVRGGDMVVAGVKKGTPFTADESGETVRILADGSRQVESWTGKMARNSDGRVRRDVTSGNAHSAARPFIMGADSLAPVAIGHGDGTNVIISKIDAENAAQRAVIAAGGTGGAVRAIAVPSTNGEGQHVTITKIEELAKVERAIAGQGTWVAAEGKVRAALEANAARAVISHNGAGRMNTRKEELGSRDFGGITAEGTRIVSTITEGSTTFETTSEIWFSKDLGVVVYSKRIDSRGGESTYQMTNIVRAEPDASLFNK